MARTFRWSRWVAGVFGVTFAYVAYAYLTLPDVRVLAGTNPVSTAFIELRRDEAHAEGKSFTLRRRWVPYGRISSHLKRAVIVAEDSAFFEHEGLDYEQIKESLEATLEDGGPMRGASTITQQLAKNLYLSPTRNPVRKLKEIIITRRLETALTKRRIFEIYLNSIEWGDGIFGCEAAARAIINPRVHSPLKPTRRLLRRQQIILGRMGRAEPPADAPAAPGPASAPSP
jgi:monofunctional glycosyltransferase